MTDMNGVTPPDGVEPSETPLAPEGAEPEAAASVEPDAGESKGKSARTRLLEDLADCAERGPMSVSELLAATQLPRSLLEVTISRACARGLILRTSPGHYVLAPPPPPETKPPPQQRLLHGESVDAWIAAVEAHRATGAWDAERFGPPPDAPRNRVPFEILVLVGKGIEQREQAEAAARADYALMNRLIEAAGGNILNDSDEIGVVREIIAIVPIEMVFKVLKQFAPRTGQVPPKALLNWRDPRFLKAVADEVAVSMMIPAMLKRWSAAPEARVVPRSAV
jgi:hypothetical protein